MLHRMTKITAFVTAALLMLMLAVSASASGYVIGDADGDGSITSQDATVVQRVVTGIYSDDGGSIAKRAAVTGNMLTVEDATQIQRFLAHLDSRYHIGDDVEVTEAPTEEFVFPTGDNQLPIIHG